MKIFLSYASEDAGIAGEVNRALTNEGHKVFFSGYDFHPGEGFDRKIRENIEQCDIFIFLISPDSVRKGKYTLSELRLAEAKWVRPKGYIIPVLLRETPLSTIPALLARLDFLIERGHLAAELAGAVAKIEKETRRRNLVKTARVALASLRAAVLDTVTGLYATCAHNFDRLRQALRQTAPETRWMFAVLAVPVAAAFLTHYAVNGVTHRPEPHGAAVVAIAVSSDGTRLASLDASGELRLMELASRQITVVARDPAAPRRVALHAIPTPGGNSAFTTVHANGHETTIGNFAPQAPAATAGPPGTYVASAVNSDSMIAIALARTDFPQQQQQKQVAPAGAVYAVQFHNPWTAELLLPTRPTVLAPYAASPTRAIFRSSSRYRPFLIGFADGTVGIITFNGDTPRLGVSPPFRPGEMVRPIHLVASSGDGAIASVDTSGQIKLWQIDKTTQAPVTVDLVLPFQSMGHTRIVMAATFSPDGRHVVTGSYDYTAQVWDVATGALLETFEGHAGPVIAASFSSDGRRLLTGSDDQSAVLWDAATGARLRAFVGHTGVVTAVAFSPDGSRILTGSGDNTVRLWNVVTGAQLGTFEGHTGAILAVAFSPDGSRIITGSADNTVRQTTNVPLKAIRVSTGTSAVALSPDGSRLITGSRDNIVRLWNAITGAQIRTFKGHTGIINAVAFSRDGSSVITGSADKTARLWDAETGALLGTFEGHTGEVNAVAFSPDGSSVVTGSDDNTARIWRLDHVYANLCLDCVGAGFTNDGTRLVLATGSGRVFEINPVSGLVRDRTNVPAGVAVAVADVAGQGVALGMADGETMWFDIDGAVPLGVHADTVSAAVKLADGRVALGFLDGAIEIVDPSMHGIVAAADLWPEMRQLALAIGGWARGLWEAKLPQLSTAAF